MSKLKPYQVWCKQDGAEARCLFSSHTPSDCRDYAHNKIVHGNNVEWIEFRDLTGVLETVFKRSWDNWKKGERNDQVV